MKDAKKYLEKFKRADIAIDAFYDGSIASSSTPPRRVDTASMTQRLNSLFDKYKGVFAANFTLVVLTIVVQRKTETTSL